MDSSAITKNKTALPMTMLNLPDVHVRLMPAACWSSARLSMPERAKDIPQCCPGFHPKYFPHALQKKCSVARSFALRVALVAQSALVIKES
jgi:hypothetical protein